MHDLSTAFVTAFQLILSLDANLLEIVGLSLRISLTAVLLAALVALPLGAAVALFRFPGRTRITSYNVCYTKLLRNNARSRGP